MKETYVDKYVIMPNHTHIIMCLQGGHAGPPLTAASQETNDYQLRRTRPNVRNLTINADTPNPSLRVFTGLFCSQKVGTRSNPSAQRNPVKTGLLRAPTGYGFKGLVALAMTIQPFFVKTMGRMEIFNNLACDRWGPPLHEVVEWFKTMTTNEYIRGVKSDIYPPFNRRVWQRSYHDHIIRNEEEYLKIWQYIDKRSAALAFPRVAE